MVFEDLLLLIASNRLLHSSIIKYQYISVEVSTLERLETQVAYVSKIRVQA